MNKKILPSKIRNLIYAGRASASASAPVLSGSITIEAAAAVPLFFLAVVSLLYLMEMMAIECAVRSGLQYAGKCAMEDVGRVTGIRPSEIEKNVVHAIGAERLARSVVEGGDAGVDCSESRLSVRTGIGELSASYQVRLPIPIFGIKPVKYRVKMKIKTWTGYEKSGFGTSEDETVYVTATGMVYHRDYHCIYLDLSIHMVSKEELEGLRNDSGGKYYPCEHCGGGWGGVYITDSGDRYHGSLSCSALKRTVYAVPLSEAAGKGACSKCGQ